MKTETKQHLIDGLNEIRAMLNKLGCDLLERENEK